VHHGIVLDKSARDMRRYPRGYVRQEAQGRPSPS
jgi:hypothetical protein